MALLGKPLLVQLVALLWLAIPAYVLGQGLAGLYRRARLLWDPVEIEGQIVEVRAAHVARLEDATVVDVLVRYGVDGAEHEHATTRGDHQRRRYEVGGPFELMYERSNPLNVIDARAKPWDDVIGPVVFGLLLLAFMGWLLLFVSGLT